MEKTVPHRLNAGNGNLGIYLNGIKTLAHMSYCHKGSNFMS